LLYPAELRQSQCKKSPSLRQFLQLRRYSPGGTSSHTSCPPLLANAICGQSASLKVLRTFGDPFPAWAHLLHERTPSCHRSCKDRTHEEARLKDVYSNTRKARSMCTYASCCADVHHWFNLNAACGAGT